MKINCHNTFGQLKEIILGDICTSVLDTIDNRAKRSIMEDVLAQTKEDLEKIEKQLQSFGVNVLRPDLLTDYSTSLSTPFFTMHGSHLPLSPRDILLAVGDQLIITSTADRTRFFEQLAYHKIFDRYSESKIISMPMPTLSDSVYENVKQGHYFNNQEPLLDGSNVQLYGKDIFLTQMQTASTKGITWLKNIIGDEYRYHVMPENFIGHIDCVFNILKPGVLLSSVSKKHLPDFFQDWDVIVHGKKASSVKYSLDFISENIQDDDFENTILDINILNINDHTLMINQDLKDTDLPIELEKRGFNIVFSGLTYVHFVNQGLKCILQETVRDGVLEDYCN